MMSNAMPHRRLILTALAIFGLALLPRIWGLGGYLTTDERFWIESSVYFLGGLLNSEFTCPPALEHQGTAAIDNGRGLVCTARSGNPGVVTMWMGSLGLWLYYLTHASANQTLLEFLHVLPIHPVEAAVIPWVRLPVTLVTSAGIALAFLLIHRVLGATSTAYRTALLATALTALSPFEIALARVLHNDALETTFTTLAVLAAFHYWINRAGWGWLILSGMLAAAGILAKSPGLFLLPFVGFLGLWHLGTQWHTERKLPFGQVLLDGLVWFGVLCGAFVVLWPAMWVIPGEVLHFTFGIVFTYAIDGHERGNFFLGTVSDNPGVWFYPVSWLLRTTPPVLVGLLLLPLWKRRPSSVNTVAILSLVFIIGFMMFMLIGSTKQDRYLLPVYPFASLLAAIGWASLPWVRIVPTLVIGLNALLAMLSYPYYFTYYNPLTGGLPVAARVITVGWGEGLNEAAAYLNRKPGAEELRVAAWYGGSSFGPFFEGETLDYYRQKGRVLAGDYVVVYINQRQRQLPDAAFFEFVEQSPPEKVISLAGVPHVWIYPGLSVDHYVDYEHYAGLAALLGWEYTTPGVNTEHPALRPGQTLDVDVWWEYLGKSPGDGLALWLVGADYRIWVETTLHPEPPESGWQRGQILREAARLSIPPGTPPGEYNLYMGLQPNGTTSPAAVLLFNLEGKARTITVEPATPANAPYITGVAMDDSLRLLAWDTDQTVIPEDSPFDIELFWQAQTDLDARYQASLELREADGVSRWQEPPVDLVTFYPTSEWRAGEFIRSQLIMPPDARRPGGYDYELALTVYREGEAVATLPLLTLFVEGRARVFALPSEAEAIDGVTFGEQVTLAGMLLPEHTRYAPGESLTVALFWQAAAPILRDYTVFVQLLGPDGKLYGQMDALPQVPTSAWTPGEILHEAYALSIDSNAPPGEYRLIAGLYHFETGERLSYDNTDFATLALLQVRE